MGYKWETGRIKCTWCAYGEGGTVSPDQKQAKTEQHGGKQLTQLHVGKGDFWIYGTGCFIKKNPLVQTSF